MVKYVTVNAVRADVTALTTYMSGQADSVGGNVWLLNFLLYTQHTRVSSFNNNHVEYIYSQNVATETAASFC